MPGVMKLRLRLLLSLLLGGIALCLGAASAQAAGSEAVCAHSSSGHAHCDALLLTAGPGRGLLRPHVLATPAAVTGRRGHLLLTAPESMPQPGSPAWLQQAYDLTALSATRGAGDTVAIVDAMSDPGAASDLARFRATYGLGPCTEASGCLRVVNQAGQAAPLPATNAAWATEETLDLQAVSAVCPRCLLLLVETTSSASTDLLAGMQTAADLGANQISDSWSVTAPLSPFGVNFLHPARPGAALPAVFAASGDAGLDPLGQAEYPAALPSVTAVGGTTLEPTDSAAQPRGVRESAWSNAGAGCAVGLLSLAVQGPTGCPGRAYSDVSADADPATGLDVFQAAGGGWAVAGGTSLATPTVAAFAALTGVNAASGPGWAYASAGALNPAVGGTVGHCSGGLLQVLCVAGGGYSGPTGAGSISGAVIPGAPGIASPAFTASGAGSDVAGVGVKRARLAGGIYLNGETTTYVWQYGPSTRYGFLSVPVTDPAGSRVVPARGVLTGLRPHTRYHVRLVARSAAGIAVGPDMTFFTRRGGGRTLP